MPSNTETTEEFYGDQVHDWEEICQLVLSNQQHLIRRNREGQRVYQQWINETLETYGSITNYLRTEKLHFPATPPADPERPHVIVLKNDYPYSTEPGIEHILIWSQTQLSKMYVQEILEEHFSSAKWEWVYFVNPPETQSVREVPHVHVFMRPRIPQ